MMLLMSPIQYKGNFRDDIISLHSSDRKPGVGSPGAPGGPVPEAGPGDCTCKKPGAG